MIAPVSRRRAKSRSRPSRTAGAMAALSWTAKRWLSLRSKTISVTGLPDHAECDRRELVRRRGGHQGCLNAHVSCADGQMRRSEADEGARSPRRVLVRRNNPVHPRATGCQCWAHGADRVRRRASIANRSRPEADHFVARGLEEPVILGDDDRRRDGEEAGRSSTSGRQTALPATMIVPARCVRRGLPDVARIESAGTRRDDAAADRQGVRPGATRTDDADGP